MILSPITTLFLDLGGVLLTNGFDSPARKRACETFSLDINEVNERHHLTFDTYEEGKLTLDEYLSRVVFYEPRKFTPQDFKNFLFQQSQPHENMISLIRNLKRRHNLKVAVLSNEGRELIEYRIKQFELSNFVDFFIVSCFVHFRKPDADIYRIALDVAQVTPEEIVYLEDREMFVDVARGLGLRAIHHQSYDSTRAMFADLGLALG
jgi:putative hydrolase of the HAD superfamily